MCAVWDDLCLTVWRISHRLLDLICRFDRRDLGQVLIHLHDADIEIGEGPEPPAWRRQSNQSSIKEGKA